jgi:hypothetical protein
VDVVVAKIKVGWVSAGFSVDDISVAESAWVGAGAAGEQALGASTNMINRQNNR